MKSCCERMRMEFEKSCDEHPDPADCPDHLIAFQTTGIPKGLWIHDGGSSFVGILYCPWCGVTVKKTYEESN